MAYKMWKAEDNLESFQNYWNYVQIVNKLNEEINNIKSNPQTADWKRLTHNAEWKGYSAGREALGTPLSTPAGSDYYVSSNSSYREDSPSVSPSGYANEEPLNYNPLYFISDNDGGESSYKNDRG